jgi:c-di-GMP-binding flagellar brake protein YcgR
MSERRNTRRYDLTLPISIRFTAETLTNRREGKTRDISTRGLYFVVTQDLSAGSDVDITLTLPAEVTKGSDVFVRAQGKVIRVEPRLEDGEPRLGVAAVIERYDIVRGNSSRLS